MNNANSSFKMKLFFVKRLIRYHAIRILIMKKANIL